MNRDRALELLGAVATGQVAPEAAIEHFAAPPVEALGFASVDTHRALRQGYPEVIFAQGKTVEQLLGIAERLAAHGDGFLATRTSAEQRAAVLERFPDALVHDVARTAWLPGRHPVPRGTGTVCVVTAGTTDLPVAEECAVTLAALGNDVARITDVGVAGIHRVLAHVEALRSARVTIVVAGMDGALPSVVGGLVAGPVIAVPTSVGYGAAFGGVAPLLTALNSCSAGVVVVNIDNGFGAAVAASRITHA
ncbi:MAG: nickel pincer cofactor biosynthesis protein LarB [Gemmatimonadaceae bacterium]|nr:nickel pincer cofactor biosynthesis protein LarB [Gemmatimonadaceae bacterium]